MSKEFEEWKKTTGINGWTDADAFTAGRALGRREMKGACKAVAAGMPVPDFGNDMKYDGYYQATDDIADAIETLIDQPQEDVCCEWTRPDYWEGMHDTGCGQLLDYEDAFKFCPYCGKPIKVKE